MIGTARPLRRFVNATGDIEQEATFERVGFDAHRPVTAAGGADYERRFNTAGRDSISSQRLQDWLGGQ